ncbi:hypothetical protein KEM52_002161 [Ascosphaera acerosa]|nr:hypothetical protein KEM52_002161 [Ascosphaera acerosa]
MQMAVTFNSITSNSSTPNSIVLTASDKRSQERHSGLGTEVQGCLYRFEMARHKSLLDFIKRLEPTYQCLICGSHERLGVCADCQVAVVCDQSHAREHQQRLFDCALATDARKTYQLSKKVTELSNDHPNLVSILVDPDSEVARPESALRTLILSILRIGGSLASALAAKHIDTLLDSDDNYDVEWLPVLPYTLLSLKYEQASYDAIWWCSYITSQQDDDENPMKYSEFTLRSADAFKELPELTALDTDSNLTAAAILLKIKLRNDLRSLCSIRLAFGGRLLREVEEMIMSHCCSTEIVRRGSVIHADLKEWKKLEGNLMHQIADLAASIERRDRDYWPEFDTQLRGMLGWPTGWRRAQTPQAKYISRCWSEGPAAVRWCESRWTNTTESRCSSGSD